MQLRDYQINARNNGVKILERYNILYLAFEVRTGKTITALSICDGKKILFVTKKKAMKSISADIETMQSKVVLVNYESVHKIKDDFDIAIIDESHSLGAYPKPSERTKALKEICKGKPIIFLSGTPTPESYSQIYHQFYISDFSPFGGFKNFYEWARIFVDVKKKYVFNRELNDYSHADEERIKKQIQHLFLTYTQRQAGFVQKIQEEVLFVKMNNVTKKVTETLIKDWLFLTKQGDEIIADTAVKMQQKLHQLYSGSCKTESGKSLIFDVSKGVFIRDYFKGKKIAIYYKFKGELEILKRVFKDNLTDDYSLFNNSSDLIFASQFVSGREGVKLDTADYLVMFNIDFSALSYLQTRDRMQSLCRTKENKVFWIFAKDGIEEKIYEHVKNKQDYTNYYFKKDFLHGSIFPHQRA